MAEIPCWKDPAFVARQRALLIDQGITPEERDRLISEMFDIISSADNAHALAVFTDIIARVGVLERV